MPHEFDGAKYEKASAHQTEWGAKLIGELHLRGAERILDLGCGHGGLTAKLAALVPNGEVIGIDASEGMIRVARAHESANLRFLLMDINDLNFNQEFDVIFSNATLHWIKDHVRLLANCHRALRPAGLLRFNFAGDGNCENLNSVILETVNLPEFRPCFADFEWPWFMPRTDVYRALLRKFPFIETRVWEQNADRCFPDKDTMIKWIDQPSLVPFLAHLDDAHKQPFRDRVVQRMIERTCQPDERCFETFRRINIFARRAS